VELEQLCIQYPCHSPDSPHGPSHTKPWLYLYGDSVSNPTGLTIQRKSHVEDEALPAEERQRAVRRPLWILGFGVYISSNVFGSG
jgi:hypothetical protein